MTPRKAPKLEAHTVVDPSMIAYLAVGGLVSFALVSLKFGTIGGILAGLFTITQIIKLSKVFKNRLPPGWVFEYLSWLRYPSEIYPGEDTEKKPLLKTSGQN